MKRKTPKSHHHRYESITSGVVENTNVVVVPQTKTGAVTTSDGRVVVDVMIGLHQVLHFRMHQHLLSLRTVDVVAIVNVIIIADTNIQTMRVVIAALIDGTTGQGKSQVVDVERNIIPHHEGRNIATDVTGHVQDLVRRLCRNDVCHRNLDLLSIER